MSTALTLPSPMNQEKKKNLYSRPATLDTSPEHYIRCQSLSRDVYHLQRHHDFSHSPYIPSASTTEAILSKTTAPNQTLRPNSQYNYFYRFHCKYHQCTIPVTQAGKCTRKPVSHCPYLQIIWYLTGIFA